MSWLDVTNTIILAAIVDCRDVKVGLALEALEGNLALDDIVLVSGLAFLKYDIAS